MSVLIDVAGHGIALGAEHRLQRGQRLVELAIIAADARRDRLVVVDAEQRGLGMNGEEALEQAVVDQVLGHAGEPARLDISGDDEAPVGHVDVAALDPVDALRAAVIGLQHQRPRSGAAIGVAAEPAEKGWSAHRTK